MHWGGKWREMLKDYPETWESGNSLWAREEAENIMKGSKFEETLEAINKKNQESYNKAYMAGYNKRKEEENDKDK